MRARRAGRPDARERRALRQRRPTHRSLAHPRRGHALVDGRGGDQALPAQRMADQLRPLGGGRALPRRASSPRRAGDPTARWPRSRWPTPSPCCSSSWPTRPPPAPTPSSSRTPRRSGSCSSVRCCSHERPTRGRAALGAAVPGGPAPLLPRPALAGAGGGERHRRRLGRGLRPVHPGAAEARGAERRSNRLGQRARRADVVADGAAGPGAHRARPGHRPLPRPLPARSELRAVRARSPAHARRSRPRCSRWSSRCSTRCGPSSSPASGRAPGPSAAGPIILAATLWRTLAPWVEARRRRRLSEAPGAEPAARTPSGTRSGTPRRAPGRPGTGPRRCRPTARCAGRCGTSTRSRW